jgi:hypothetical protein
MAPIDAGRAAARVVAPVWSSAIADQRPESPATGIQSGLPKMNHESASPGVFEYR